MTGILVGQNYYTPYRAALYDALADSGVRVLVAYAHRPEDDGRSWRAPPDRRHATYQSASLKVGRLVLFVIPLVGRRSVAPDLVILNDNNPTNAATIFWACVLRITGARCLLWVEHIPDPRKGRLKAWYQARCTRLLARLSHGILAWSAMTRTYLAEAGVAGRPVHAIVQAAPPPAGPAPVRGPGRLRAFGFLGSGGPRKNVRALVDAFTSLAGADLRLHIAGHDGRHGDGRIAWHGYVEGAARETFFAQVDLLLLPSLSDPWGLVVNEALMRGCLAAASTACGSSELVRQIAPWLSFSPDPKGIAECLHRAVALDEAAVSGLRAKAVAVMPRYSIEAAASALSAAVQKTIG